MKYKKIELKKGIEFHTINVGKFKTNLIAVFLTTKLNKENVTKNALISLLLRRGSKNMSTQEKISKELEEMYGATFDCGLDKTGENQIFKFYIETINNKYIPHNGEDMWKEAIDKILEIVFDPYIEKENFKEEYINQEKNTLKQLIQGRKDNKAKYAAERCIEEMYKGEEFGLFKYGNIEDLENIEKKELYEKYKELIKKCKIDIFVSGEIDQDIEKVVKNNNNILKLNAREPEYNKIKSTKKDNQKEKIIEETMEVAQGKLVIGLDVNIEKEELKYNVIVYNGILGGSANSKLFQNVREKEHLAYVVSSNYLRQKNNIFIHCGIDIQNYKKTLEIVKEQLEDMKKGKFTEEEIEKEKKGIIEAIKTIYDEQDSQITYYFGQELTEKKMTIEEYIKRIEKIKKEDILKIANLVNINTIYFLKN